MGLWFGFPAVAGRGIALTQAREVLVRDPGPMARLEDVKADALAPSEVFHLLTDADEPLTLREIAKAWGVPKGRFVEWFTTTHAELYDAALKVRAADLAIDALKASKDATPEDVPVHALRAKVALQLAAKWDRARYGERVDHKHMHVVDLGERLRRAGERVIEAEPVVALPAPQPEPAPVKPPVELVI